MPDAGLRGNLEFFKLRREMPERRRRVDDPEPPERVAVSIDFDNGFHYIIDVALGIDTPRNSQADQFQGRMRPSG